MATVLNRAGLHSQQAIVILPRFLRIISLVYTLQLHDFPRSTSSGKSGLERRASSHSRNLSQMDPWLWGWAQLMTFPQGDFSGVLVSFSAHRLNQDHLRLYHWTSDVRKKWGCWNIFPKRPLMRPPSSQSPALEYWEVQPWANFRKDPFILLF